MINKPLTFCSIFRLTVSGDHSSSEGDTEGSDRPTEPAKHKRHTKMKKVYKKTLRLTSEHIVCTLYSKDQFFSIGVFSSARFDIFLDFLRSLTIR